MKIIIAILSALLLSGCATVAVRAYGEPSSYGVYPAVKGDILAVAMTHSSEASNVLPAWEKPLLDLLVLIDLPVSIVLDTILLPFDIYNSKGCK